MQPCRAVLLQLSSRPLALRFVPVTFIYWLLEVSQIMMVTDLVLYRKGGAVAVPRVPKGVILQPAVCRKGHIQSSHAHNRHMQVRQACQFIQERETGI